MRASGILMPITSLPSNYGIGCFSKEAYEFVDQLVEAGQKYWQILPLGPTGYGDSPYQSFSTFAGNPYFIDLESLIEEGLLTREECEEVDFGDDAGKVDYGKLYVSRNLLLKKAFLKSKIEESEDFKDFCEENETWLYDYCLYREIKNEYGEKCWNEWEDDIRQRKPEALKEYGQKHREGILFQQFLQYEFYIQWKKVRSYANEKGIEIIGDIPIYISFDSADVWSHPELFQLDEKNIPIAVAGCPPDAFSATGQLWGNPLYRWEYHEETGYDWWIQRVLHCLKLYDVVRIDHFRGFDEYYSIPYGEMTAQNGKWMKGPGMKLFRALKNGISKEGENIKLIAEDLGYLTESVIQLVKDSGYPGMKLLQFAFDSRESGNYLPFNYDKNTVVYTGTHDNATIYGWYGDISDEDRKMALDYLGKEKLEPEEVAWEFIRLAQSSVSDTCIIPIWDYLSLGNEARMNVPSKIGGNWVWRLKKGQITGELLWKIKKMSSIYGRV